MRHLNVRRGTVSAHIVEDLKRSERNGVGKNSKRIRMFPFQGGVWRNHRKGKARFNGDALP